MKTFNDLIAESLADIREIFPWDLVERLAANPDLLLLDIREPYEFDAVHIRGSLNVPRGILETACEWDFEETIPELVKAREREVVVICRSGNRSIMAAHVMQQLGFNDVVSLKTGIRGWNDYEQPMVDGNGSPVDNDYGEEELESRVLPFQQRPTDA